MIERCIQFMGEDEVDAVVKLAERLQDLSILHVNSTAAGGGVAEILNRLVPLMRELGLRVDWRVIRGDQEFFAVTKTFHNALQVGAVEVPRRFYEIYHRWQEINANELGLDHEVVFIHDPQPAGLVKYRKKGLGYGVATSTSPRRIQRCGASSGGACRSATPPSSTYRSSPEATSKYRSCSSRRL